jgi:type I restriction enzyme S subunit
MLDEKLIVGTHLAPYLRNVDVQWEGINTDDLPLMDFSEEDRKRYALREGDLLVCEGGEVGRTAIWNGELDECFFQKAVHRLRPTGEQDEPRYFRYFMRMAVDAGLFTLRTASTIPHLTAEQLRVVRFPAPARSQQRTIADFLDRETSRIDALIAAKQRLLRLLAEKRRALITSAVTRGLDRNTSFRGSGIGWFGEIPAHWEQTRLKFVARVQTGLALGKQYRTNEVREYPYLRVANVQDGYLDLSEIKTVSVPEQEARSYLLCAGDVLMNEGGDADKLGRGAVWTGEISPCLHQNHVFAVRARDCLPDWLALWISTGQARAYFESRSKQSTNLASISATNLMEMPLVLPQEEDQAAIVEEARLRAEEIDAVRVATERSVELLKERRGGLIAAAVTGQIDVREAA